MSSSRVFLEKTDTGVEYAWFDDSTGDLLSVERVENVEPTLEACKEAFNEGLVNRKCEFRRVGSYPLSVLRIFGKKWGLDLDGKDPDAVARLLGKDPDLTLKLLADRDLSGFRTLPGTYG